ncbi:MAG: hypothetical protein ACK55A_17505, partial [Gemmatimonas sp.]
YVQSRRRFPKEGKILLTTRGEEKVIACDIFNERVTLRTVDGDTRVVPLAELKGEMGGAEHSGGTEERGLAASTAEYAIETAAAMAELEPQSMSMLDTMEFEAFTVAQLLEGAPALAEMVAESVGEAAAESTAPTVPVQAGEAGASAGGEAGEAPKRKRRRGRRGGRRLRAAEERRRTETDGTADGQSAVDDGDDVEGDDD